MRLLHLVAYMEEVTAELRSVSGLAIDWLQRAELPRRDAGAPAEAWAAALAESNHEFFTDLSVFETDPVLVQAQREAHTAHQIEIRSTGGKMGRAPTSPRYPPAEKIHRCFEDLVYFVVLPPRITGPVPEQQV